jgi:hypothetical protein
MEQGKMSLESWSELAAERPIEGRLLTCKKGMWGVDGEEIPMDPTASSSWC